MLNHSARSGGFTLVELLVVIAIIGLLASISIASLSPVRGKARDTKRVSDLGTIRLALETYYSDNRSYPENLSSLSPIYISPVPKDPKDGSDYFYLACNPPSGTPRGYHLGAVLENSESSVLSEDNDSYRTDPNTGCGSLDFRGDGPSCTAEAGTDLCYDLAR